MCQFYTQSFGELTKSTLRNFSQIMSYQIVTRTAEQTRRLKRLIFIIILCNTIRRRVDVWWRSITGDTYNTW